MADKQPLVSIITINYNNVAVTCDLLLSIGCVSYRNIEVIVVDNASAEDPTEQLKEVYPAVKVIVSKENLGFAGGNNLGIRAAHGQYLFFVNSDTVMTAD